MVTTAQTAAAPGSGPGAGAGQRQALVVRGGWDGHEPQACTDRFIPFLTEHGFAVTVSEDLAVYADTDRMTAVDLVVHCWSQVPGEPGELTREQVAGLAAAVRAGTGLAGWHGGIVASSDVLGYLHLTGGRFVYHPPGFVDHELTVVSGQERHPIMAGVERVWLHTEKYWVVTDPLCEVLATVTFPPDHPGDDPHGETAWRHQVTVPAVWTRRWGAGRVFVSTVGHRPADLDVSEIRRLTGQGMLWAAGQ